MNANSAKSPTSSTTSPTATTSVTTAVRPKTVTINENETVQVSEESKESYYATPPVAVNSSAFKCGGCNLLTVHQGYEFTALHVQGEDYSKRRVYVCTNCGKFVSK